MKATIVLWLEASDEVIDLVARSLQIESSSSPPGGMVTVDPDGSGHLPLLEMYSDDLSTARAMLNSYLGLVSIAVEAASVQ